MGLNQRLGIGAIHNLLSGRGAPDAHPQAAITGLTAKLADVTDELTTHQTNIDGLLAVGNIDGGNFTDIADPFRIYEGGAF
jgi:hypothetical protein